MAGFSSEDYFNNRAAQDIPTPLGYGGKGDDSALESKHDSLMKASAEKSAVLRAFAERRDRHSNTLAGKLGLEDGSLANLAVDGAAHLAKGAGQVGGFFATLLPNAAIYANDYTLTEEHIQAYNRYRQNEATPEDIALLNQTHERTNIAQAKGGIYGFPVADNTKALTNLQVMNQGNRLRQAEGTISKAFDWSAIADGSKQDVLQQEIGKDFGQNWEQTKKGFKAALKGDAAGAADSISGIAKILFNAGEAVLSNPTADAQYMLENLPQLAIGAVGKVGKTLLGISNVGYAADNYTKGIVAYQAQNGGALPSAEERQTMAMQAVSLAAAENVGSRLELGFMKTAKNEAGEAIKTGFKKSLLNTADAGMKGFTSEALTEGYQTYTEGEILQKPASAQEIFTGGVIGGVAGAGLSGGGRAVAELAKATPEHASNKLLELKNSEDFSKASEANDPSAYLDASKRSYAPATAVAVLLDNTQRDDATLVEKQSNLEQANKIVQDVQDQRDNLQDELAQTTAAGIQAEIDKYQGLAANAPAESAAAYQGVITELEKAKLARETESLSAPEQKALKAHQEDLTSRIAKLDNHIAAATQVVSSFSNMAKPQVEEVAATVALADSTEVSAHTSKAAETVIKLAMAHPGSLQPEQIKQLVQNTGNSLSAAQRTFLKHFSEAQVAEHKMLGTKGVTKQIFEGDAAKKQLGIAQYRSKVGQALLSGNQKAADYSMALLGKFVAGHQAKATYLVDTLKTAQADRSTLQVLPDEQTGQWGKAKQNYTMLELKKLGGYEIHANSDSKGMVTTIIAEAKALQQAQRALRSAYDLQFTKSTTVPAVNSKSQTAPAVSSTTVSPVAEPTKGQTQSTEADSTVDPTVSSTVSETTPAVVTATAAVVDKKPTKRTKPRDYQNLVGAILRVTGDAGISVKKAEDLLHDKYSTFKSVRHAVTRKGWEDTGKLIELLNLEEGFSITDENQLADLLAEHDAGNPVYNDERTREEQDRSEAGKYKEYVRTVSQQAKDMGLKGVRGRRTLVMVEADIARVEAERLAFEIQEERLGMQGVWQEMDSLVEAITATGVTAEKIEKTMEPQLAPTEEITDVVQSSKDAQTTANTVVQVSQGKTQSRSEEQLGDGETEAGKGRTGESSEATHGGLTVFQQEKTEQQLEQEASKLGLVYRTINKAQAFLTQKQSKVTKDSEIGAARPLVDVKNLLSQWTEEVVTPDTFFADGLIDEERDALEAFRVFANKHTASVAANFIKGSFNNKKNANQLFRDPIQDFMNEDGSIDSNVVTAVIYAGYAWFNDSASAPAFLKEEAILSMHGQDPDATFVTGKGKWELSKFSAFEDTAINAMGNSIIEALGLQANEKAPVDYLPKLAAAFGAHAMQMLKQQGLIATEEILGDTINEYIPSMQIVSKGKTKQGKDIYPSFTYVRLVRNPETHKLEGAAALIKETQTGSMAVLDRMFNADKIPQSATWKPRAFKQDKAKRTQQGITEEQTKILDEAQKAPNRIIPAMWDALSVLGDQVFLKAAGWQQYEEANVQLTKRAGVLAQNQNLEAQLDGMKTLVNTAVNSSPLKLKQPFFATFEVWRNYRVGVTSHDLNLQNSKIHRFSYYRPEWESKISMADPVQVNTLLIGLAQAFGVKIDQQANDKTQEIFAQKMTKEGNRTRELALALHKAIAEPTSNSLSEADKTAIGDLAANAEGMQTLQALVAYGIYLDALHTGKGDITVHLLVGVDGKTNGPILTHLALGAAEDADDLYTAINRGGMYREQDGYTNYNHWYEDPLHLDLYQDLAQKVLVELPNVEKNRVMAAIQTITGPMLKGAEVLSAGRNLVKTPLTSFSFGSSLETSVKGMMDSFVGAMYDRIEVAARSSDPKVRAALAKQINVLLEEGAQVDLHLIPSNPTQAELMELEFTDKQVAAIYAAFNGTVGLVVEETMKTYFTKFIERRNEVNGQIQTAYALYETIYQDTYNSEIQRLIAEDVIASQKEGDTRVPLHDLTKAQEEVIRQKVENILPRAHTVYSEPTGNLDNGLFMAKTSVGGTSSEMYKVEVQFGQPFEGDKGTQVSQKTTRGMQRRMASPGVAGLPYFMHSLDSGIMHRSLPGTQTLNVHDEASNGVNNADRTAEAINHSTWSQMLHFSPATEAYNMLERVVLGAVEMVKAGEVSKESLKAIEITLRKQLPFKIRFKTKKADVARLVLDMAKTAQVTADTIRLGAMAQMTAIDQYTWEGGEYQVTEKDRAEAAQMLKELEELGSLPAVETTKAARQLGIALDRQENAPSRAEIDAKPDLEGDQDQQTTPWGNVGKASVKSNQKLVEFFKKNEGELLASQVIDALVAHYKQADTTGFNRQLLALVKRVLDPNLKLTLITPATTEDSVLGGKTDGAMGWYVATESGKEAIYVLSPEFVNSGLTPELLLHELVHGALAKVIKQAQTEGKGNAWALVQELEELRKLAIAKDSEGEFTEALKDVQEMVSWGMTNLAFQEKILSQISMPSTTTGNVLVTGIQDFIKKLAGLLLSAFKVSAQTREQTENGLGILVSNVTGLFQQAAKKETIAANVKQSMAATVNSLSTLSIYDAIKDGNGLGDFDTHLRGLLEGMVDKLHGPFGSFKAMIEQHKPATPLEAWVKSQEPGGVAPFASASLASGFPMQRQVAFVLEQVEVTVRSALEDSKRNAHDVYTELDKLYLDVQRKMSPEGKEFYKGTDWATATVSEKQEAQALYNFIFKLDSGLGNKTDHLSRFAALGLAHPEFNAILGKLTTDFKAANTKQTFIARLESFYQQILEWFNQHLTHTYAGQQADLKLTALVEHLVSIDDKRKQELLVPVNVVNRFEDGTKALANKAKEKAEAFGRSDFFKRSKNGFVKASGSLLSMLAGDRQDYVLDAMLGMRDQEFKKGHGILAGILNEVRGANEGNKAFHLLSREGKRREAVRRHIADSTAKVALESFADQGKQLSQEDKAAITTVFLRTDVAALTPHFTQAQIHDLLTNRNLLLKEIRTLEKQLDQYTKHKGFYKKQAKILAYSMVTGDVKGISLLRNASNIAQMWNTTQAGKVNAVQAKTAEAVIDQLVSLRALGYTPSSQLAQAATLMATENARGAESGIDMVLKLHASLQQQSKERLFAGNEGLMIKGYTPELYNPNKGVVIGTDAEGITLVAQGYVRGEVIATDPHDPDKTQRRVYKLEGGGARPWLSGIFSYTGERAKGSRAKTDSVKDLAEWKANNDDLQGMHSKKRQAMADLFKDDPDFDPSMVAANYTAPVFDAKGGVTDYVYLMRQSVKDSLLDRDNRFDAIMGSLAGNIYDKQSTKEQNRTAVQALYEQYQGEYIRKAASYRRVGPHSTDPELLDIYRMLPEDTKQAIKEIWGDEGMLVRTDLMDINFGYRKWSLSNSIDKDSLERNFVEKFAVGLLKQAWGEKAGYNIRRGEDIWQELVHETKDIFVIKNVVTLLGNVGSNISLLYWYGVPIREMIHSHRVAFKGAVAYRQDSAALAALEIKLAAGKVEGSVTAMKNEVIRLQAAIDHNPVKEMIDAGLMPTIVEDVSPEDDRYSYKARLVGKMEEKTKNLHKGVVAAGKLIYMAKDTRPYQALHHATQLSDFIARYTLYQHLINKKNVPMDKAKAIQVASDAFINYDLPSHRLMQYGNDVGVIWFTKYYIRIQKVISHMYAENPGRALMLISMGNFFDGLPLVTDSGIAHRGVHNPLSIGAFKYPGALDELAAVKAGMQFFH